MVERYNFKNFIVTNKNDFAYSAAKAITQFVGISYNPLFIYGSAGVGKTYLLYSIMNEIIKKDKNKNALYVDISTVKNVKDLNIKDLDVLLIDNFEFLNGNYEIQKDFYFSLRLCVGFGSRRNNCLCNIFGCLAGVWSGWS